MTTRSPDDDTLDQLCDLIEATSGIFIDDGRREYLGRDLLARLRSDPVGGIDPYIAHLRSPAGRAELDQLVELATIGETYFLREPNHFRALTNHILPALVAQRRTAITIWSAGCSTGEEVYSIAISVLRMVDHLKGATVRVLGTDVSARAIERARLGHYGKNSFRTITDSDLKTFFVPRGRVFEVREPVREICDFRVMNLLEEDGERFFEGLDVIFCRNVTIYFREATIRKLNRRLTNSLRAGGYLIFGASETLQHQDPELSLIEVEGAFLYRKGPRPSETRLVPPPARHESGRVARASGALPRPAAPPASAQAPPKPPGGYGRALVLVREERYEEATPLLLAATGPADYRPEAVAMLANIHINREEFGTAESLLEPAMKRDPMRSDLHLLSGLLRRYQHDDRGALQQLKRAAYLDPDLYLAHYYLAETYRSLGKDSDAVREYRNAARLLERPRSVPEGLLVLMAGFPPDYIARVCARHGRGPA